MLIYVTLKWKWHDRLAGKRISRTASSVYFPINIDKYYRLTGYFQFSEILKRCMGWPLDGLNNKQTRKSAGVDLLCIHSTFQVSEMQSYECHQRVTNRIEKLLDLQLQGLARTVLRENDCRNKLKVAISRCNCIMCGCSLLDFRFLGIAETYWYRHIVSGLWIPAEHRAIFPVANQSDDKVCHQWVHFMCRLKSESNCVSACWVLSSTFN